MVLFQRLTTLDFSSFSVQFLYVFIVELFIFVNPDFFRFSFFEYFLQSTSNLCSSFTLQWNHPTVFRKNVDHD